MKSVIAPMIDRKELTGDDKGVPDAEHGWRMPVIGPLSYYADLSVFGMCAEVNIIRWLHPAS